MLPMAIAQSIAKRNRLLHAEAWLLLAQTCCPAQHHIGHAKVQWAGVQRRSIRPKHSDLAGNILTIRKEVRYLAKRAIPATLQIVIPAVISKRVTSLQRVIMRGRFAAQVWKEIDIVRSRIRVVEVGVDTLPQPLVLLIPSPTTSSAAAASPTTGQRCIRAKSTNVAHSTLGTV